MSVETDKKNEGTSIITAALEEIRLFIEGKKGQFKVKDAVSSMDNGSLKSWATRTSI